MIKPIVQQLNEKYGTGWTYNRHSHGWENEDGRSMRYACSGLDEFDECTAPPRMIIYSDDAPPLDIYLVRRWRRWI